LDPGGQYIWSSSTLYPVEVRTHRSEIFRSWLDSGKDSSPESIMEFHEFGNPDPINGFVMNRSDLVRTLSITQMQIHPDEARITNKILATAEISSIHFRYGG